MPDAGPGQFSSDQARDSSLREHAQLCGRRAAPDFRPPGAFRICIDCLVCFYSVGFGLVCRSVGYGLDRVGGPCGE